MSGRVQRRQAEKYADRDAGIAAQRSQSYEEQMAAAEPAPAASAAPAAAPMDTTDLVSQLRSLAELRDQGILTEEEFAAQKAKLLG
ncbi:MAG TPA: SHOCT domain-containing protein [Ornithinibacter sp.]|nr:SHOCT domain-containing protein [Ornithinibacter sp.]